MKIDFNCKVEEPPVFVRGDTARSFAAQVSVVLLDVAAQPQVHLDSGRFGFFGISISLLPVQDSRWNRNTH